MISPRPSLTEFRPIQKGEQVAYEAFLTAYNSPEERPIKNFFEVLAEYDMTDGYLAWCVLRGTDPNDDTVSNQYNNLHWAYLVAWRALGWYEFNRRLSHARMILHSLTGRSRT